ncbi:unnamed protein product [Microthlaspi erraticum]|uniref:Uncharacterized protein n=1 Tax=Microthlaspi erraticum TaxID=1685480 RepID=A0A6D2L2Y4_9BRAS|nr:unnamed protein product [Microthlaspi erraticum]CAA7058709.1 unnamed protein product [Microthlaspi erraticum]
MPRQTSTTVSGGKDDQPDEMYPADCCVWYLVSILLCWLVPLFSRIEGINDCYVELFAHSVSVTNATNGNVSTADWRVVLIPKSPVTGCNISLDAVTWRLLRGDKVISEASPSLDDFGKPFTSNKTDWPATTVDFKKVVTPGVIGSVIWDYGVEIAARLKAYNAHGFLMVSCGDIPVKFTADARGNVIGSLFGNMRRCDYVFRK